MNSQQLQCFIYVAERLNFTKAAEALYLSVPTVTHHIKSLEEELGIPLFYRTSRIVRLTEQGERFYYNAKEILGHIEKAKKQFQNNLEQETVPFRIGCMTEREFENLENILKKMKKQYPNIRPKIIRNNFFTLKNLFENQQLDLVIAVKGLTEESKFKEISVYSSYVVVPKEHPLASEQEVTFEQLKDEMLITLPSRAIPFEKGNTFQESLTLHAQDHIHMISETEAESILLAKCGYGLAVLPGFLIPKDDSIAAIPIRGTKNIKYGIYYRENNKYISFFKKQYCIL